MSLKFGFNVNLGLINSQFSNLLSSQIVTYSNQFFSKCCPTIGKLGLYELDMNGDKMGTEVPNQAILSRSRVRDLLQSGPRLISFTQDLR